MSPDSFNGFLLGQIYQQAKNVGEEQSPHACEGVGIVTVQIRLKISVGDFRFSEFHEWSCVIIHFYHARHAAQASFEFPSSFPALGSLQ